MPPPRRKRRRWRLIVWILSLLFAGLIGWLLYTAPLTEVLSPAPRPSLVFLSTDSKPFARAGAAREEPVDAARLPPHVTGAFVAIEDRRFRSHWGVDPRGIARATWANIRARRGVEGGSTITQQLAKTAFLTSDRTLGRKAREVLVAFWLEAWLSKDEILSRYLSTVYFGDGTYGLRAAAHRYFSRSPEELSVSQAAMLAGLLKAPTRLAPTRNLAGARARAKLVVAAMRDTGVITADAAARARPAILRLGRRDLPSGSYFSDWLLPTANDLFGETSGETRIATTLNARMQAMAERVIRSRVGRGSKMQAAIVVMRPDGRVLAVAGGRDYAKSPFNRAVSARRQPGSAFKTFVYFAALRGGATPDDRIEDTPLEIDGWKPKNSDGKYRGTLTLRDAFARSSNVAAVRLSQRIGTAKVIRAARDLGIRSPLSDDPSLALGTSGVTLLELTAAYAAIAAGEYPVTPKGLAEAKPGWKERLGLARTRIDRRYVWPATLDLLWAAANEGTGRAAAIATPSFGKTGTTQDHRDALFVGFAGDLVVGVWVGNDDNSPMAGVTGGGLPARMWRDFMSQVGLADPNAERGLLDWVPDAIKGLLGAAFDKTPAVIEDLAGEAKQAFDYIERETR